jgi:hypothetical protein
MINLLDFERATYFVRVLKIKQKISFPVNCSANQETARRLRNPIPVTVSTGFLPLHAPHSWDYAVNESHKFEHV